MTTRLHGQGRGPRRRVAASLLVAGLAFAVAGCGGDDDGDDATTETEATGTETEATDAAGTSAAGDDTADDTSVPVVTDAVDVTEPPVTEATSGTWDPGEIQMRVVNLLADPVDVYVRTTGLVEAYEAFMGVEPGVVTELVAPPAEGSMVITVAGSGDPECVATCPHILAQITASEPEGPVRTVIMHEYDGVPSTFDLWESPTAERLGNSNSMPDADPAQGLVIVSAVDLVGADFGLRLGFADATGCVEPVNLSNVLVGGNQTPAFGYTALTADVSLYDNNDRECAGPVVGGPFTVAGGPGTRTHLILTGEPNAMEAIVLPMVGDEEAAAAAIDAAASGDTGDTGETGDTASSPDRDLAIELMAVQVQEGLGIPADQSACVAALLVDAIGVDVLLVDGALIELDTLPTTYDDAATDALIASVDACGVDPALFGEA